MKRSFRIFTVLLTAMTVCLLGGSTVFSFSDEEYLLASTPDAGLDYQNALVFLGESTTAHLRARGALTDGTNTKQVLSGKGGTLLLSKKLPSLLLDDPLADTPVTLTESLRSRKPAYLVLSFGLNGITGFAKDPNSYLAAYQTLIDTVQAASPKTAVILQTVYPVTAPTDGSKWGFSHSVEEINKMIQAINQALPTLAAANTGVRIADTASVLRKADGSLDPQYSAGDGIHLNAGAYTQILAYLRTHAYHIPTPLPITKNEWRRAL